MTQLVFYKTRFSWRKYHFISLYRYKMAFRLFMNIMCFSVRFKTLWSTTTSIVYKIIKKLLNGRGGPKFHIGTPGFILARGLYINFVLFAKVIVLLNSSLYIYAILFGCFGSKLHVGTIYLQANRLCTYFYFIKKFG